MPRKTFVFDLDDTLYLMRDFAFSGFRFIERHLARTHPEIPFAQHAQQLYMEGVRGDIFDRTCKALNLPCQKQHIENLVQLYRRHYPQIRLFPEVMPLLQTLSSRGHRLAIITDGHAPTQQHKVYALGLESIVPCIVYTDALDCSKPDQRPFKRVMSYYRSEPEDCLYIGDNPHKDFIGAKALGWQTARYTHPLGEHANTKLDSESEADADLLTLSQVEEFLRKPALV